MEIDAKTTSDLAPEPDGGPVGKNRKRPPFVLILLLILSLCAASAGAYVLIRLDRLEKIRQAADALSARGDPAQALDTYTQLIGRDPLSFTSFGNAYVRAGENGVLACADALLGTTEGARYLSESRILDSVMAQATHPAVSDTFGPALKRRALLCEAILAEEAGDLEKAGALLEQADLRNDFSCSLEQQLALADALRAREEGRYDDAVEILTRSMTASGLAAEVRQQIVDERDAKTIARARDALTAMDPDAALQTLQGLSRAEDRLALETEFAAAWADTLNGLHERYGDRLWAGAWYTLALGAEPRLTGDERYAGLDAASLQEGTTVGGLFSLIQLIDGHVHLWGDTLGSSAAAQGIADAKGAALGMNHGLILHENGSVTPLGATQYGRKSVEDWTDIVQVAAGAFHSLGLKADGTAVAAGLDLDGQCQVAEWTDIISVAAGLRHSVGLLQDGHVVAVGDNSFGQCDVSDWENIIDIRCGGNFTLGLTADWRLLAAGDNSCGQCDVSDWREVVAFDGGLWHTAALLSDGRIVTAGANDHGQCAMEGTVLFESKRNISLPAAAHSVETELVYWGHQADGPWLYCGSDGCVIIAFDAGSGKIKATRADLICTQGHPPVGILSGGGDRPVATAHPAKLAMQNKAVFAITGDYYRFDYNAHGLKIRRGVVFQEEAKEVGISFFPDGSMRIVDPTATTARDLLDQGIRDCWVFGPTLIRDGAAMDISGHPLSYNDVTMRTAIATICPYHHVAAAYSYSTLAQVTADLLDYGCEIAYNLDGGRSCMMVFLGRVVNRSIYINNGEWRGLEDMVGFLTSDLVPKP